MVQTVAQRRRSNILRGIVQNIDDVLVTLAFIISPAAIWILLIMRLELLYGVLIGWVLFPFVAAFGAALTIIWTVPLRLARRSNSACSDGCNPKALRSREPSLTISVIMPVYNAERYMARSLPPLMSLLANGGVNEVIVVDDSSTDGSPRYASQLGAKVIRSGGRHGPGAARNIAAQQACGDILWFVDADVVVHKNSAQLLRSAFEPDVTAIFGSYDDRPPAENFGSQYKNLVHHHYHQGANTSASTFWSGCGAVRKEAFLSIGGFDVRTFSVPSVEDIDLGYRLCSAGGTIRLHREILSTHLKVWSVRELVYTDIFRRAVPWARLMLRRAGMLNDLNVSHLERLRAAIAGVSSLIVPMAIMGVISPWWLLPTLLTVLTCNWDLFCLFRDRRGFMFAMKALLFHQAYYLYSSAAFTWCWLEARLIR